MPMPSTALRPFTSTTTTTTTTTTLTITIITIITITVTIDILFVACVQSEPVYDPLA